MGTPLRKTLGAKVKQFLYIYDFGDCWEHAIDVGKMCPRNKRRKYPCCTGGENECPPEDVGGIGGYRSFLEAYNNPDHEDHEMFVEWCGPGFDSGRFDLRDTNKRLRIHLTKKLTRMAYEMDAEILRQASSQTGQ